MLEIALIETQWSKCSLNDRSQNLIRKYRKYLHFFGCENEKNMSISYFWSNCTQSFSIWLKYLPETEVDSKLSSKNVRFRSKNARFCSKIFSRLMLEIARWSLEIFICSKCSTIFPLEIARIENSKSKIVLEIARIENFDARNAQDRCFCRSVSTSGRARGVQWVQ